MVEINRKLIKQIHHLMKIKKTIAKIGTTGILLFVILLTTHCKKDEKQTTITYPASGKYGTNILGMNDNAVINSNLDFSLAASLQIDANLKIILTNLSSGNKELWFYDFATTENWTITDYNTSSKQQTFTSTKGSSLDLLMSFTDTLGYCKIDFYENNSQTPTKSKHFSWH